MHVFRQVAFALLVVAASLSAASAQNKVVLTEPMRIAQRISELVLMIKPDEQIELKEYVSPVLWANIKAAHKTDDDAKAVAHVIEQATSFGTLKSYQATSVEINADGKSATVKGTATYNDGRVVTDDVTYFVNIAGRWYVDY